MKKNSKSIEKGLPLQKKLLSRDIPVSIVSLQDFSNSRKCGFYRVSFFLSHDDDDPMFLFVLAESPFYAIQYAFVHMLNIDHSVNATLPISRVTVHCLCSSDEAFDIIYNVK